MRRSLAPLAAALALLASLRADPGGAGPRCPECVLPPALATSTPEADARRAARFLYDAYPRRVGEKFTTGHGIVKAAYAYGVRFLDAHALPEDMREWVPVLWNWYATQLTFQQQPGFARPVPGTGWRWWWLDLHEMGWEAAAWDAVAARDPYTREPLFSHEVGEALRALTGARAEIDPKTNTLPLAAAVRLDWLLRDALESNRSPTCYDLLYGRFRFGAAGEGEWETVTINHPGGDYTAPAGAYDDAGRPIGGKVFKGLAAGKYEERRRRAGKADPDFPRTLQDALKAFGVDLALAFGADARIQNIYGAVVEGGRDFPGKGSIVALNNRLVVMLPAGTGPARKAMLTFDVKETAGARDYVENAAKLPFQVLARDAKFKVVFDAGEALLDLPDGGQATLLFNNQFKRTELAAQEVANAANANPCLNSGVATPIDCHVCHGAQGGFNMPKNRVREALEAGVDFRFASRDDEARFRGFYLGWERQAPAFRLPYNLLLSDYARPRPPAAAEWDLANAGDFSSLPDLAERANRARTTPPWDGAELAQRLKAFRQWYDGPLAPREMAYELGVPQQLFRRLAAASPGVRLNMAERGRSMPRSAWEKNQFIQAALLLDLFRRDELKGKK